MPAWTEHQNSHWSATPKAGGIPRSRWPYGPRSRVLRRIGKAARRFRPNNAWVPDGVPLERLALPVSRFRPNSRIPGQRERRRARSRHPGIRRNHAMTDTTQTPGRLLDRDRDRSSRPSRWRVAIACLATVTAAGAAEAQVAHPLDELVRTGDLRRGANCRAPAVSSAARSRCLRYRRRRAAPQGHHQRGFVNGADGHAMAGQVDLGPYRRPEDRASGPAEERHLVGPCGRSRHGIRELLLQTVHESALRLGF